MGKEYGHRPSAGMNLPPMLDVLALDEAIFWIARAQDLQADTRRTVYRNQQNRHKQASQQKGWNGVPHT